MPTRMREYVRIPRRLNHLRSEKNLVHLLVRKGARRSEAQPRPRLERNLPPDPESYEGIAQPRPAQY